MITAVLSNRFIHAPPLWGTVIRPFEGLKHAMALINLVDEYLLEEHGRLIGMAPAAAASQFIRLFSKRYFPIKERNYWREDPVRRLVDSIPADLYGMDSNNYEPAYNNLTPGQLVAEMLCVCPFERFVSRITVLDAFRKKLGDTADEIIRRLPEGGFRLEQVEEALAGEAAAPYPGLLARCRWLFSRTGNIWLDKRGEVMSWERASVDRLARDWPACQELDKEMKSLDSWLGHDFNARCAEVVGHVRSKIPKTLMEVFDGESRDAQE